MLLGWLLAPVLLLLLMRVALVDPREPATHASALAVGVSVLLGWLPFWLVWAPDSPAFNAALCLALATVLTPLLFSAMKTEGARAWIGDKVFLVVVRSGTAAILAVPLMWCGSWWFIVLGALSLASFVSRSFMWTATGGSPRRYSGAVASGLVLVVMYWLLVESSQVTAASWTNWRGYLYPSASSVTP